MTTAMQWESYSIYLYTYAEYIALEIQYAFIENLLRDKIYTLGHVVARVFLFSLLYIFCVKDPFSVDALMY